MRLTLCFTPRETYRSYNDKTVKTDALLPEIKIGTSEFHFQKTADTQKVQLMQTLAFSLSRIKNGRLFSYINKIKILTKIISVFTNITKNDMQL